MSAAEETLALQLKAAGHKCEREYMFAKDIGRRWRADFAFPYIGLLVEVEGITRFGKNKDGSMRLGRHQTAKGYEKDCEKYNAAALLGWRVLRFTPQMVSKGEALRAIEELLE